jgi:hypothetical protein
VTALGPVDHLARPPLPWRHAADLTECGIPLANLDPTRVITAAALDRRIRDLGQQRTAYTTCMTCWSTAGRWRSGEPDPIQVIVREAQAVEYPGRHPARRDALAAEVEAIVALVAAHREEFDGYLAGRSEAVSLADRRRRNRSGGAS